MTATMVRFSDRVRNDREPAADARPTLPAMERAADLSEDERRRRVAYIIDSSLRRLGMKPPQLALKVGKTRGTVNEWAAGRSTPSLVDLAPLCAALHLDPRVFAELPPIPDDPLLAYLLPTATAGVEEGLRRDRARGSADPGKRAPSPRRRPRGIGAEPE